jgi:hypothetical protein
MKKLLCIAVITLMAFAVTHAAEGDNEPGSFGLGYQGVSLGDGYLMNQIALRFAPQPVGGAIVIGQMASTDEGSVNGVKDEETDTSLLTLQGKVYWTLIERPNSDFYIGGLLGFGWYNEEYTPVGSPTEESDYTSFVLGFLAGVEWRFTELPELGLNFELGYNLEWMNEEDKVAPGVTFEHDTVMAGTSVSLGATYYF